MARAHQRTGVLNISGNGDQIQIAIAFTARHKVGTKADLLGRALGKQRSKKRLFVVDATAGLCRDSLHLLALGCEVIALERNSKLYEVFSQLPPPSSFTLVHADAVEWLNQRAKGEERKPDIVYLDPMFPEKKKSAAVSKESRALQLLEYPPTLDEEGALLKAAKQAAQDRVIVKRPKHAPWLAGAKPNHEFVGKAVRYDVYVTMRAEPITPAK